MERRLQRAEERGTPAAGRQTGVQGGRGPVEQGQRRLGWEELRPLSEEDVSLSLGRREGVGIGPSPSHWGACSCPPPGPAAQGGVGAGGQAHQPSTALQLLRFPSHAPGSGLTGAQQGALPWRQWSPSPGQLPRPCPHQPCFSDAFSSASSVCGQDMGRRSRQGPAAPPRTASREP